METTILTKKLNEGNIITTKQVKRPNKATRIEVDSTLYDNETIFQDVTLDTAYEQWQNEELKQLFNIVKK